MEYSLKYNTKYLNFDVFCNHHQVAIARKLIKIQTNCQITSIKPVDVAEICLKRYLWL